jgi:plasmid maintenance system antidote protein VapI
VPRPIGYLDGRHLRDRLFSYRLSQRDLARHLGISDSELSRAIRGAPIKSEMLARIERGLAELEVAQRTGTITAAVVSR